MTSRWPRLVLLMGGLASIATSQIAHEWELVEDQPLPVGVLDQTESIKYPIRVEIRGSGPYNSLNGVVTATLQIDPRTVPALTTLVTVRLRSLTHPEIPVQADTVYFDDDAIHEHAIMFPSWDGCENAPCAESFELEIVRGGMDSTIYDITGSVAIDAAGDGEEPPDGTSLTLTIGAPQ